jgi:hypothetical protein
MASARAHSSHSGEEACYFAVPTTICDGQHVHLRPKAKGEKHTLLPACRPECPGFTTPWCGYFFVGAITSFAALATRNFTTVLALILIA